MRSHRSGMTNRARMKKPTMAMLSSTISVRLRIPPAMSRKSVTNTSRHEVERFGCARTSRISRPTVNSAAKLLRQNRCMVFCFLSM